MAKMTMTARREETRYYTSLEAWIMSEIRDHLAECDGSRAVYSSDLAFEIFESENVTGSYECNAFTAIEWICKFFCEISDTVPDMRNEWEYDASQAFENPEAFQVCVILYVAERLLSEIDFPDRVTLRPDLLDNPAGDIAGETNE